MVLFKTADGQFVDPNGKSATDEQVETFLASLEPVTTETESDDDDLQELIDANDEMGRYIADIVTLTGAADSAAAKVAVAEAIAKAGKMPELDQQLNDSIAQALSFQSQIELLEGLLGTANARIAELEKPVETAPSIPAELEKTAEVTAKKGK